MDYFFKFILLIIGILLTIVLSYIWFIHPYLNRNKIPDENKPKKQISFIRNYFINSMKSSIKEYNITKEELFGDENE